MLDLRNMSIMELEKLKKAITEELKSRTQSELVLYTHGCKNSSNHHLRKYKHWAKLIKSVDTTKTNGYAFIGDFLSVTSEHKVPVGSIIVSVCDNAISAWKMTPEGKEKIASGDTKAMSSFIDEVSKYF